jgi:hypothetical protein
MFQACRALVRSHRNYDASFQLCEIMEHRGVKYSIIQGTQSGVWKWSVLVGDPEMLRMGEAETEYQAEVQVRLVIDRALALEEILRKRPDDESP